MTWPRSYSLAVCNACTTCPSWDDEAKRQFCAIGLHAKPSGYYRRGPS